MFELSGLWLAGAIVLAFLVGVFASRYIKDVLKGVPSSLRTALNATETNSLATLRTAETKAVSDVVGLLPVPKAVTVAVVKTVAPAAALTPPAAASVAAPAAVAVAAANVKVVADKAASDIAMVATKAASDIHSAVAAVEAKV